MCVKTLMGSLLVTIAIFIIVALEPCILAQFCTYSSQL